MELFFVNQAKEMEIMDRSVSKTGCGTYMSGWHTAQCEGYSQLGSNDGFDEDYDRLKCSLILE